MMRSKSRLETGFCFAIKIMLALALLVAISQYWGHIYIEALLPLYRSTIHFVLPNYQVVSLNLLHQQTELVVAAQLITTKAQVVGSHPLPVGVAFDASTLAGHALKHLIIVIAAIIIWPASTSLEYGVRSAFSVPLILLIECIDIPLAIAGAVQDLVYFNLASDYATNKPLLVTWLHMLDGGGRLALSIIVALVVILASKSCSVHLPVIFKR